MANGDTKTEALLNILGNGGSGDEYRGCCNTKTQQYILDAIDRINEIQPGGDTAFTVLTDDDANYTHPDEPDTPYIALWLLPSGKYIIDENATIAVLPGLSEGAIGDMYYAHQNPIFLSSNILVPNSEADIHALQAEEAVKYIVAIDDGEIDERNAYTQPFTGTDGVDPGIAGLVPIPEATDADKFLKSDGTWSAAGGGAVVKTLTTADYNFPANNPIIIAGWLLPVGQYIVAPHTNFSPDGNSSSYLTDQEIGVLVLTQVPNNSYATCICSTPGGETLHKTQANGTPAPGYPHTL